MKKMISVSEECCKANKSGWAEQVSGIVTKDLTKKVVLELRPAWQEGDAPGKGKCTVMYTVG